MIELDEWVGDQSVIDETYLSVGVGTEIRILGILGMFELALGHAVTA